MYKLVKQSWVMGLIDDRDRTNSLRVNRGMSVTRRIWEAGLRSSNDRPRWRRPESSFCGWHLCFFYRFFFFQRKTNLLFLALISQTLSWRCGGYGVIDIPFSLCSIWNLNLNYCLDVFLDADRCSICCGICWKNNCHTWIVNNLK